MKKLKSFFFRRPSTPAPPLEFVAPWRTMASTEKEILQKLKDFQLTAPNISQLRILLHGPVGAGKSSFINSVDSALRGCNTSGALANALSSKSFTRMYKTHEFKKNGPKPGALFPFVMTDIMGLEVSQSNGIHTGDIINILKGHIKEGYTFNPVSPHAKADNYYNSNPTLKDKVHCLVSILPADNISRMSDEVIDKMKDVREMASEFGIPQVVIMTMVDKACPIVGADLTKIYYSRKIKDKMQECSNRLGVPMNCIFPVQNYHEQITNNVVMDILLLMALTNIITFANDYVEMNTYTE